MSNSNIKIKITINQKVFEGYLEDNPTTKQLIKLFPLTLKMNELNGNEFYSKLNNGLTTNTYNPKTINLGDLMLYQNDYFVIFYKTFKTSYSYTRLGFINNLKDHLEVFDCDNLIAKIELA